MRGPQVPHPPLPLFSIPPNTNTVTWPMNNTESTLARGAKLSHALVWPVELGLRTPTLQRGHFRVFRHAQEGDSLILRWVAMMGPTRACV